ncbi:MAG: ATP-grasp domain-containing protein [Planctomycetales bacterium]
MSTLYWILESDVFPATHPRLRTAIRESGNQIVDWQDDWLSSGRLVSRDRMTLAALDHGFYYDDSALAVVVAPVCEIGREWRFVIVSRRVVAGSGYDPQTRRAVEEPAASGAWAFASEIAAKLPPPEEVYVMDICESSGNLRLLELNPFSGADLYAASAPEVVAAIGALVHA